jgi:hypothetical protein
MNKNKLSKEQRVNRIIDMMRDLAWKSERWQQYCDEWGVTRATLKNDEAEAARALTRFFDTDASSAYLLTRLQKRIDACVADGDDKNLVALMTLMARITGLEAARRHEVVGSVSHTLMAFDPAAERKRHFTENNRLGDLSESLNAKIISEKHLPGGEPMATEGFEDDYESDSEAPF